MLPSLCAGTLSRAIVITLIHTYFVPIPHYDFLIEHPADNFNDAGVIFILKRPALDEFMEAAAKLFEVVVFTASSRAYADPILPAGHERHINKPPPLLQRVLPVCEAFSGWSRRDRDCEGSEA